MTQYFIDATALSGVSDFTQRDGSTSAISLANDTAVDSVQSIKITPGNDTAQVFTYDPAGNSNSELEVYLFMRDDSVANAYMGGAVARFHETDNCFFSTMLATNDARISKTTGGTVAAIAVDYFSGATDQRNYHHMRFQVLTSGATSTLKVRVWNDGDSEPGTWDISTTNNSFQVAGYVGLLNLYSSNTAWFRKIGIGTGGDAAPTAPLSGGSITGTGVLIAGAASTTGVAERQIDGTGSLQSATATISATGERQVDGAGSLNAGLATIAGIAERQIDGIGALAAGSASTSGTAERVVTATGVLVAGAADISAVGSTEINGTGTLSASLATIDGVSERQINGTGVLTASPASIDGSNVLPFPHMNGEILLAVNDTEIDLDLLENEVELHVSYSLAVNYY